MLKVSIAVGGKFHLFHLARQLEQKGLLNHIVSSYPRYKLTNENISSGKLISFPYIHLAWMMLSRYGLENMKLAQDISWRHYNTLDYVSKINLGDSNVLVALSGVGLKAGHEIQKRGGIYLCDRGSSHIRYQNNILSEEFERWRIPYRPIDARKIVREESEYQQADAITVPSDFARNSFIQQGIPAEKLYLTPYGVELSRFFPVAEPDQDSFNITFVGSVSLRKGVPYLLQAFAAFRHPAKRLRIVGSIQEEIRQLLNDGTLPTDNVEFLGPLPHMELKNILSSSHVFVLPSIEEGLSLVQAEAMACGCPVISSDNTGGRNLFHEGVEGFIVPIRDPMALTDRIECLAQDPQLRSKMSVAAINRVKELGGWDTYCDRYISVIEHVSKSTCSRN